MADTSTREYHELVADYRRSMGSGADKFLWRTARDTRYTEPQPVIIDRRFRKPTTSHKWRQVRLTDTMHDAYCLLVKRQQIVTRLTLPADSPIPGQVDAALRRFCGLAEALAARRTSPYDAHQLPEHAQAVELASQIAALVDLAERREAVISHVDTESLRRTAQALATDLNTARSFLAADPIDRELTTAGDH